MAVPSYSVSQQDRQFTHGRLNSAPVQDPYYGRSDLVKQSALEAFNYNITQSAIDYARYWARRDGQPMTKEVFEEAVELDGIPGMLDWKEDMTVEQYVLASKWAQERRDRLQRIQYSTRGFGDKLAALGGSFAGSMIDPVELATVAFPALRVETHALKLGMANKLGMSIKEVSKMARQTPKAFSKLAVEKKLMPIQGSFFSATKRGFKFGAVEAIAREPFIYGFNTAANKDYTFADTLVNIGASSLLGGFFHGAINRAARMRYGEIISESFEGENILPESSILLTNKFIARFEQVEELFERQYGAEAKKIVHPSQREEGFTKDLANFMLGRDKERRKVRVYMGSAVEGIEQPDFQSAGTGEGVTAYGFGIHATTLQGLADRYREAQARLRTGDADKGSVYEMTADLGEGEILDWNSLMESQPHVQAALMVAGIEPGPGFLKKTGGEVYAKLAEKLGSEKKASEFLESYRIKAIRWQPESSKHPSYVIFDGTRLQIEKEFRGVDPELADDMRLRPGFIKDPFNPDIYGRKKVKGFPDEKMEPGWRHIDQEDLYLIANVDEKGKVIGPYRMSPDEVMRPRTKQEKLNTKITYKRLLEKSRKATRNPSSVEPTNEQTLSDLYESVFGVEVRFLDPEQAQEAGIAGRVYSRHAGTLFVVSSDLPKMSYVAGHEFFHAIKWQDPELFMRLIHVINKYDAEANGNLLHSAFTQHMAGLLDDDLASMPIGKHYEEAYANIFGEVSSRTDFWENLRKNVSKSDWARFEQAFSALLDRMIRWVVETLDSFGVKDSRKLFKGLKSRNEILDTIGNKKVASMIGEITDMLDQYRGDTKHPFRSIAGDKALNKRIQDILAENVGKRTKKIGIWEKATRRLRERMEAESIIVTAEHSSEALASQLSGDPLIDLGSTPPIPKDKVRNIRQYALSIPSSRNRNYARLYAEYSVLASREIGYQAFIGPQMKKVGKKVRELRTRVEKAWESGDRQAHARLLKSYKEQQDTLVGMAESYKKSKKLIDARMNEIEGVMGIVTVDHGDHYIVHYHKEGVDRMVRRSIITDNREIQHSASGNLQLGAVNPGEDIRWFDPSDTRRVFSTEEVLEFNDVYFKDDPVIRFSDDISDGGTTVSERNIDWGSYAANQRGNSVHYRPMDELVFGDPNEALKEFDPNFMGMSDAQVRDYRQRSGFNDPLTRKLDEESDDMAWSFYKGLDTGGKTFVNNSKRAVQQATSGLWDRLRVSFEGPQHVDERVFIQLRGEAGKLDGHTTTSSLTEAMETTFDTPSFIEALHSEYKYIWARDSKPLERPETDVLSQMSLAERQIFTRLNRISGRNAKKATRMFQMARSGHFEQITSSEQFVNTFRKNQGFMDLTDSELEALYDQGRRFHIRHLRAITEAAEKGTDYPFRPDFPEALYQHLQGLNDIELLQEMRSYKAARDWTESASRFQDNTLRVKWLLARMDGAFRKHLPPDQTPPSLTHNLRSRQVAETNPLMQVLSRHEGVWDEFTAADSSLAKRVFLYMETGDDAYVGDRMEIREIADVLRDINKAQVYNLNARGANVAHRPDYTISAIHNRSKMQEAGFDYWADFIAKRLDWEATFDRIGVGLDPQLRTNRRMYDYLREVYEDVMDNRFRDRDNPIDEFNYNLSKEPSYARSLVFRENGLWQYDTEFGSGSPVHALMEQIMRRSDLIELMDTFGPRPAEAWARIKQNLRLSNSNVSVQQLDKLFEFHTGQMDNPVNRKISEMGQMARLYANTVFLGNAGISAINDTVHSMDALTYMGIPLGRLNKQYWDALVRAYKRNKGGGFQAMMRAQGAGADVINGAVSRRVNGEVPGSEKVRKLGNMMFSLNGLNLWTTIAQEAMIDVLNRNMHRMIGFDDFDRLLGRYGMDAYDMKIIKDSAAEVADIDGNVIKVTPDMVGRFDYETARKYRLFLDDWMRQGVLEPNASGQIFARFGLQSGTPLGEAVRTVTQYMAFGFAVQQKTYRRMLYGYGDQGFVGVFRDPTKRRIMNMMGFAAWSMALGYISMNVKEVLRGREPIHFANMNNNNMRKWIFQSGVAGPLADLLWARDVDDLPGMLAGPFFGATGEIGGEILDTDLRGLLYDLERNSPLATLPVVGEARRQLFGLILGDALIQANQETSILFDQKSLINNNTQEE